jgi:hypothetical protein
MDYGLYEQMQNEGCRVSADSSAEDSRTESSVMRSVQESCRSEPPSKWHQPARSVSMAARLVNYVWDLTAFEPPARHRVVGMEAVVSQNGQPADTRAPHCMRPKRRPARTRHCGTGSGAQATKVIHQLVG